MARKKQKSVKLSGFIEKLVDLLRDELSQGIVEHNTQTKTFSIKNIRRFTQEILPKYFKHRNFSSFVRQVNLYGFHKQKQQEKEEIYSHQFFNIDQPRLLKKIRRKPTPNEKTMKVEEQLEEGSSQEHLENSAQLQQLIQKRDQLRDMLRREQQANQKLEHQNRKLKSRYNQQNRTFCLETLNLVENILISQLNQGTISHNLYKETLAYLYKQREFIRQEQAGSNGQSGSDSISSSNNLKNNRSNSENSSIRSANENDRRIVQNQFWEELKRIINGKQDLNAQNLLEEIYKYINLQNKSTQKYVEANAANNMRQLDNLALVKNYQVSSKYMPERQKVIIQELIPSKDKKYKKHVNKIRQSSEQALSESDEQDDEDYVSESVL